MKKMWLVFSLIFSTHLVADVYVVSDRLDFTNPDAISSKTRIEKKLSGEVDEQTTMASWEQDLRENKIAILIHGYNNEHEHALEFFNEIIDRSKHLYDTFICYLWPGGNHRVEYLAARGRATGVLPDRLSNVINDLMDYGKSIDIIAHSMGCRLSLETLQENPSLFVNNVFLMAPAVDNEALEQGETYHNGANRCKNLYIFHSENDDVLKWGYPIGEFDQALGLAGSEDPTDLLDHVFHIDCTNEVMGHSEYASSDFVFNTIAEILNDQ